MLGSSSLPALAHAIAAKPRAAPSFEDVFDEHVDFVWRSVRRLGVSEAAADDVVQQVFLVVHRRLHEFGFRSSMKSWLFAIAIRAVLEHRRSLRRKSPHLLHGGEPVDLTTIADTAGFDPCEAFARSEAAQTVERLLEQLPDDQRMVFMLAELEEMTATQISEATGLAPRTVYSRLHSAREAFERAADRFRRDEERRTR